MRAARYGPGVLRPLPRRFAVSAFLLNCTLAACGGDNLADADAAPGDDATDMVDAIQLFDGAADAADADAGIDAPIDVQPASLPGRWRLVGFESTSAGGATFATRDVEQNVTYAGRHTYARVNGTMTLAPDRAASTVSVLVAGHVLTFPGAGSAHEAMSVTGSAGAGVLGAQSFTPAGGSALAFTTHADGTITDTVTLGSFGPTQLTWERAEMLPALAGLSSQGNIVQLQPDTATPLAHPRAAIAWDRPGIGAGYTLGNDIALSFIGGAAAYPLLVTYVLPEYTDNIDGTTISIGYAIVYDDVNGNGRFDQGAAVGGGDGGVDAGGMTDGDPLRGVSPIVLTVRSQPIA